MKKEYYEDRAILFAEKYGIMGYEVIGNQMIYKEYLPIEGIWESTVNLDTMEETRKKIK